MLWEISRRPSPVDKKRRIAVVVAGMAMLVLTAAAAGCGSNEPATVQPTDAPPTATADESSTTAPPAPSATPGPTETATPASASTSAPVPHPTPTPPSAATIPPLPTPTRMQRPTPAQTIPVSLVLKDSDELSENESRARLLLTSIERDSRITYGQIVEYPWLSDGVSDEELTSLSILEDINQRMVLVMPEDAQDAFGELDWLSDGITFREARFLDFVSNIASPAVMYGVLLTGAPTENIPEPERVDLLWAQDDLTHPEWRTLSYLESFKRDHPTTFKMVLELPWLNVKDFRDRHMAAITSLQQMSRNPDVVRTLLGFSWMQDDNFTKAELDAIQAIRLLAKSSPDQAKALLNAPLELGDQYQELHPVLLSSVSDRCFSKGNAQLILDQPWFKDGITHDEVALSYMLSHDKWFSGTALGNMSDDLVLEKPYWAHDNFQLQSGEVNLYVLSMDPLGESETRVLKWARNGIETMATFMGDETISPFDFVVILVAREHDYDRLPVAGLHFGSFVMLRGPIETIVYHEIAHYYHHVGLRPLNSRIPKWLVEGWANFMEAYTLSVENGTDLERARDAAQRGVLATCGPMMEKVTGVGPPSRVPDQVPEDQFPKITHLLEATSGVPRYLLIDTPYWQCHYPLGENFLHEVYQELGPEVVVSAMKEMYRAAWFELDYVSEYDHLNGEEMVYKIFLESTPPENREKFVDLYQRLHGGQN